MKIFNNKIACFGKRLQKSPGPIAGNIFIFILGLFLIIGCAKSPSGASAQAAAGDTTPPLVTCLSAEGSTISASKQIIFSFSESMDKTSLLLSGTMALESDGGVWSSQINSNDTLTVSAKNTWSGGNQKTIVLDAKDLAANQLATFTVHFNVDATLPSANVTLANGSSIKSNQAIEIVFSETINPSSLTASGSLLDNVTVNGYIVSWSQTSVPGDTLTLTPVTLWQENPSAQSLVIDVQDSAGNPVSTISLTFTIDGTPPTVVFNPVSGSLLNGGSVITLTFSETIDRNSLVLGNMSVSGTIAWATTTNTDDTVVLSPLPGGWPGGPNTLTVSAADLAGNALSSSSNYTVDVTLPSGNVVPVSGITISKSKSIVITFSKAMSTSSLLLSGTMASLSNGGVWSLTVVNNDTLTISPLPAGWNGGASETLNISASDPAGNIFTAYLTYNVDAVGPTITPGISNPEGALYALKGNLGFVFSEAVDPATLVIGGTLTAGAGYNLYSSNTMLSLTQPAGGWPLDNQTLTITVSDIYGNSSGLISFNYGVLNTVVYVNGTSGNDANIGTKSSPKQYPQAAIDFAFGFAGVNEVHVAAGTYSDYLFGGVYNPAITLKDGVKVYGGYNATTWVQNTVANQTILTSGYTGNSNPYIRGTVVAGNALTSTTVISGFYIKTSPNGYYSASVLVDGGSAATASQPQITGNYIGYQGSSSYAYYGIYVTGHAYPVITNNVISGGAGSVRTGIYISGLSGGLFYGCQPSISNNIITNSPTNVYTNTWGIQILDAGANISKNYIDGGLTSNYSRGILINEPRTSINLLDNVIIGGTSFNTTSIEITGTLVADQYVYINQNTIYSGTATSSGYGISYNKSSTATSMDLYLRNNIIYGTTGSIQAACFVEAGNGTSIPFEVVNNDFYCTYKYTAWTGTFFTSYTLASQVESYLTGKGINVSGTLEVNPVFTNLSTGNLHLTASSPCTVARSAAYFPSTIDLDGVTRTAPQSMGAYEWDGGCL